MLEREAGRSLASATAHGGVDGPRKQACVGCSENSMDKHVAQGRSSRQSNLQMVMMLTRFGRSIHHFEDSRVDFLTRG